MTINAEWYFVTLIKKRRVIQHHWWELHSNGTTTLGVTRYGKGKYTLQISLELYTLYTLTWRVCL